MKVRGVTITAVLLLAGFICWRVEWDVAFLPARFNADMTLRERAPQSCLPGVVPFGEPEPVQAHLLYRQYCAACHGLRGEPPPFLAKYPGMPHIPNLRLQETDTSTWRESIVRGRGAMPAYDSCLSASQIDALLQYVESWPAAGAAQALALSSRMCAPSAGFVPQPSFRAVMQGVGWGLVAFLFSLPMGYGMVRAIVLMRQETQKSYARRLVVCISLGGGSMLVGYLLWGAAAFAMPAFVFAVGTSVHMLRRIKQTVGSLSALHTAALAIAAYAFAVPVLVGGYLPDHVLPSLLLEVHGVCLALLVGVAVLPHVAGCIRPTVWAGISLLLLAIAPCLLSLVL